MEPEVTSINHLPEEALAHVFSFVPSVQLIHEFRFVSSSFNRSVIHTVGGGPGPDVPLNLMHPFSIIDTGKGTSDLTPPPWKFSVALGRREEYSLKFELIENSAKKRIGLQIRLLSLGFHDFEELFRLLSLTPNVTKLKILTEWYKGVELISLPAGFVPKLKKLKSLELGSVYPSFPDKAIAPLTKSFMKGFGTQLKYLQFTKRGDHGAMDMCLNAILEANVRNVTLDFSFSYNHWRVLLSRSFNRLNSCEQDLSVSICSSMSVWMFKNLERFIQNCCQLTKLTLIGSGRHKLDGSRLFKLPLMANLRTLNLRICNSSNLFEPLQPSQFPCLHELVLGHLSYDVHQLFCKNFETVKILNLENIYFASGIKYLANKVFPNVSQLSVDLTKRSDFVEVGSLFIDLKCLTDLTLNPEFYLDHAVTLDLVGTTIIESLQICQALQRLRVAVFPVQNFDTWAVLLANLHYPLELTIINAELSDSCRALLKCRHQLIHELSE